MTTNETLYLLRLYFSDNCTYTNYEDINWFRTKEEAEHIQLLFYEAGFKDTEYEWLEVSCHPEDGNAYLDACNMMRLDKDKFFELWSQNGRS